MPRTNGTRPDCLVIFDLDGVLVDSQDAEDAALAGLARKMGLVLSAEQSRTLFAGKRLQTCFATLAEMTGKEVPQGAMAMVREDCRKMLAQKPLAIAGVHSALRRIRAQKCVASNSPIDVMRDRLATAGIDHHFGPRLFSAYDVGSWKPDPGLLLWAARESGVEATRCIVVEDSPAGIDAALAARMRVLQFRPRPEAASHAGVVTFGAMAELPGLLEVELSSLRNG